MRVVRLLPMLAALVLFLIATAACQTNGGLGVVASVQVYDAVQTAKPLALVRYDGNTLVMWGGAAAHYELFMALPPNLPLYGPFQKKAEGVYTVQREPEDKAWQTGIDEPLPEACKHLFRPIEIESWGLTFAPYGEGLEDGAESAAGCGPAAPVAPAPEA